jgi:hypothetical protein
MRRITPRLASLAVLSAALSVVPACQKDKEATTGEALTKGGEQTVAREQTPEGGSIVSTTRATATVTDIDRANRKVTLKLADGSKTTVKCSPEVRNFNQIAVGDQVNVTLTDDLSIYLAREGDDPDGQTAGAALSPVGVKPSGAFTNTMQFTAKITALDPTTRMVTLTGPDGSKARVRAGEQIDLSKVKVGDEVTVRHTEALAVSVEAPAGKAEK